MKKRMILCLCIAVVITILSSNVLFSQQILEDWLNRIDSSGVYLDGVGRLELGMTLKQCHYLFEKSDGWSLERSSIWLGIWTRENIKVSFVVNIDRYVNEASVDPDEYTKNPERLLSAIKSYYTKHYPNQSAEVVYIGIEEKIENISDFRAEDVLKKFLQSDYNFNEYFCGIKGCFEFNIGHID